MAVNWKSSIPILVWFLVYALLVGWAKLQLVGFIAGLVIGVGWLLVIPLMYELGVAKVVNQWFQKAALWAFFAAAFGLAGLTLKKNQQWWTWIVDFGLLASGFFAMIGALIGFFKWK